MDRLIAMNMGEYKETVPILLAFPMMPITRIGLGGATREIPFAFIRPIDVQFLMSG